MAFYRKKKRGDGNITVATAKNYDMSDTESAAQFYGVSKQAYLNGQRMKNVEMETTDDIYIKDDWIDKYLNNNCEK